MNCRPAIEYSLYADGALPPDAARAMEFHLKTCDRCRGVLDLLAAENAALSHALQSEAHDVVAWTPMPLATPGRLLRNIGASVALAWAPAWWISQHRPLRFVFPALLGLVGPSYIAVAPFAVLLAIAAAASWLGLRRTRGLALVLLFLAALAPARAITYRTGGAVALVGQGETVNDSLFAAGDLVRIEGIVAGDLFAFARRIEIRGTVRGNVYVFGKEAEVAGALNQHLFVWAESMRLVDGARVAGQVVAAGERAMLAGGVGAGVRFFGERLNVEESARIAGPIVATVDDRSLVHVPAGFSVRIEEERGRLDDPTFYIRSLAGFATALLLAFLAARLAPMAVQEAAIAVASWWRSLGIGIAIAVTGPIVIVIGAITVIGRPAAAVLTAFFAVAIYGAKLLIGHFAGRVLLPGRRPAIQLASGLALVLVAVELPFGIGSAVWVTTVLVGLGALTLGARRYFRSPRII